MRCVNDDEADDWSAEYPEAYGIDRRAPASSNDPLHQLIDRSPRIPYPRDVGSYSTPTHSPTMHASPKLDLSGASSAGFAGDHSLMMAANGVFPPTNGTHSPSTDSSSRDSIDIVPQPPSQPTQQMTSPAAPPPPQQQQPMHLGMALQHATGIEPQFPAFNGNDIFFQNNGLLPYPMLPFAGRGMHNGFDTKPDLHAIQSQMQMRESKPYKCTQCIKSFANSSYLSQHMRIHLGIKPFGPCQYCGKKFTQLSHLQQHIRTHTGEKPYRCKYAGCEKAFSQLSNLQSHSRCHQTDKPFKCNSCYKCFSDEQSLLEHIPKHKESKHLKVHICPFCGKSYTQATYLSKHMTKHADRTRNMPYPVDTSLSGSGGVASSGNPLDQLHWNTAGLPPAMTPDEAAQQAHQLAFSHFANNAGMMSQSYPQIGNSAFTQLMNLQRNAAAATRAPSYLDYNTFAKPTDRPAGFNMITPLENIQRYTQQAVGGGVVQQQQQQQPGSAGGTPTTNGHPFIPTSSDSNPLMKY
ncbi:hypothetical protein PMAYCL1PPCAC_05118 [Pristionchus mayeri]|uniref:C2H2-type domain-containing protein n=1 Tax=Pristionchus mayeri TaxID=1317129 RepID=A0AAN5C2T9_9BILA|nr:hypothetical protein PMAYCL1PPCAC_05118 [Pristionchus mayeri]